MKTAIINFDFIAAIAMVVTA